MLDLESAIIHAEEIADRCAATDGNIKCEMEHRQLAEWLKELQRARVLLKATHELLETAKKSPYVLDTLSIVVYYGEAECDGNCLKEDIENYFDEYGEGGDVNEYNA